MKRPKVHVMPFPYRDERVLEEYARKDAEMTFQVYEALQRRDRRRRTVIMWVLFYVALALAMTCLSGCTTEPTRVFCHDLNDSKACLDRYGAAPGYCEELNR